MPFKVEYDEIFGKYNFVVTFHDRGHRCGYLGLPKDEYDEYASDDPSFFYDIDVHGGVTYEGGTLAALEKQGRYRYIGFDTGHSGDAIDIEALKRYGFNTKNLPDLLAFKDETATIKDIDFMTREIVKMLIQLRDPDKKVMNYCIPIHGVETWMKWLYRDYKKEEMPDDLLLFIELNKLKL